MSYFMLFLSGSCSAFASILLRVAGQIPASAMRLDWASLASTPNLLRGGAVVAYGAGFVLYALALKRIELSVAYPLMVGIAILEIFGYGLLGGEAASVKSMMGALLVMAGIFLIYSQ